eukprot:scaffold29094_cov59-Phaeocystis_antarctica.AAC.2
MRRCHTGARLVGGGSVTWAYSRTQDAGAGGLHTCAVGLCAAGRAGGWAGAGVWSLACGRLRAVAVAGGRIRALRDGGTCTWTQAP